MITQNISFSYMQKINWMQKNDSVKQQVIRDTVLFLFTEWSNNMGLIDDIKKDSIKNRTKIQTSQEEELEHKLNALFYLEKDIKKELKFLKSVMTRGQETQERKGLHASAIIVSDDKFCYRQQVLSLFYKQLQGEQVPVGLKRIFSEGDAIHEKWQRLFIRGGYSEPLDCDFSHFNEEFDLSYTPDILCEIDGIKYVVEVKSVNTFQFKKGKEHPSGKKQCMLYMYLNNIDKGIVLQEDKNTQDFRVNIYDINYGVIKPYISRLEQIQYYKQRLLEEHKLVKRHKNCTGYNCKMAQGCPMRDVCYKKHMELLN